MKTTNSTNIVPQIVLQIFVHGHRSVHITVRSGSLSWYKCRCLSRTFLVVEGACCGRSLFSVISRRNINGLYASIEEASAS